MTNYQCFCYGIVAIHNILEEKLPITSDLFLDELYYLWDIYSEESIEKLYLNIIPNFTENKIKGSVRVHIKFRIIMIFKLMPILIRILLRKLFK